MSDLLQRHCQPVSGAPMGDTEVQAQLQQVTGWSLQDGAIEKRFAFKNFHRTMAFVNAVAWIAHAEDHHPDLAVGYAQCTVRYSTHSVGGISINDFICAAKIDALGALAG
jgi:4a-hydroxytetrahydrobiopterin dehydratase